MARLANRLQAVADAARTAGTMTAEAHAMLGSRLESARKALAEKSTAKAVQYLKQYADFSGHSLDSQALRDILVSGAQALIVRLTLIRAAQLRLPKAPGPAPKTRQPRPHCRPNESIIHAPNAP